jgi:hypothetical protein
MRSLLWANVVEAKLHDLERALKANFNPNQPRVPAGNPDGGRWTSTGSGGGTESPKIPEGRPPTSRVRTRLYKEAALWLARVAVGKRIAAVARLLEEAGWLEPVIESIRTFSDPPKSLEELQQAVSTPAAGYDIHHIVEQTSAEQDGFPQSTLDAPENLVRIPRLKHWLINAWYATPNEDYNTLSPRDHLRGKNWSERVEVGRKALIDAGVLKP